MAQDGVAGHITGWITPAPAGGMPDSDLQPAGPARGSPSSAARDAGHALRKAERTSPLRSLAYAAAGFLLLNGLLYGVQEVTAADDKQAVAQLAVVMDDMEEQIESIEDSAARGGATPRMEAVHAELVEAFNDLVPAYNRLAEKAYARWWLLPVPSGRRIHRATRPSPELRASATGW